MKIAHSHISKALFFTAKASVLKHSFFECRMPHLPPGRREMEGGEPTHLKIKNDYKYIDGYN